MQSQGMSAITFALLVTCTISLANAKSPKKEPVVLNEDTWTQLLQGEWMVDLYAPWCPACKKLEPEWRKFAEWSDDLSISVASADVTANPGLGGRFMISSLPTIYHVKDGVFRIYSGSREHTALINFIEEQGWKSVEPISRWRSPDTLQMSFVAYSFRISMVLRDLHNHLVEEVGVPYYVSYLIFALCTVTLGTIIGLFIVFIIDTLCPARYSAGAVNVQSAPKDSSAKKRKGDKKNDSDSENAEANDSEPSSSGRVRRRVQAERS